MRRPVALMLALPTLAASARAQEAEPHTAQPERPTAATHAYTVAPGWVEMEAGLELDRIAGDHLFATPTTLKLGLAHRLQVEVTSAWLRQSDGAVETGVSGALIALKWRLADSLPLLGAFALQPAIRLPTGAAVVGGHATVASLLVISSHDLGGVALDANVGLAARIGTSDAQPPTATFWTVSAGIPVRGALNWVVETFGFPGTSGVAGALPTVALLTGPTYTLRPWLVFDAGVVVPLAGPQAHSVYAGATWNIGRAWRAGGGTAPAGTRATAPSP